MEALINFRFIDLLQAIDLDVQTLHDRANIALCIRHSLPSFQTRTCSLSFWMVGVPPSIQSSFLDTLLEPHPS